MSMKLRLISNLAASWKSNLSSNEEKSPCVMAMEVGHVEVVAMKGFAEMLMAVRLQFAECRASDTLP